MHCCQFTRLLCLTLVAVGLQKAISPTVHAAEGPEGLKADLRVEPIEPCLVGFPVRLKLIITNTGVREIPPYKGAAGGYDDGLMFRLAATADTAKRVYHLRSGKNRQPGMDKPIAPGQSLSLFVASDPLPENDWTLQVYGNGISLGFKQIWPNTRSSEVKIVVRDDPKAAADLRKAVLQSLAGPAKSDKFAQFITSAYGLDASAMDLIRKLTHPDIEVAKDALASLRRVRRLPEGGDEALRDAVIQLIDRKSKLLNSDTIERLAILARRTGTLQALDTVVRLAEYPGAGFARRLAIRQMGGFSLLSARQKLWDMLQSDDPIIAQAAAVALTRMNDPHGAAALLKIAQDETNTLRDIAIRQLAGSRQQENVQAFLKTAEKDKDRRISSAAVDALYAAVFDDD